jgi:predicted acetyltransferase
LDEHLQELAAHREIAVGATDSRGYPYLDAYFSEPGRHAFLIECNGEVVGLALIRDPASTGSPASEVAEFYVKPGSRRLGHGREVIASMWRRFPGAWELQVHARNAAALRFWAACVEASAEEPPGVREIEAEDGKRIQFNFYVKAPRLTTR